MMIELNAGQNLGTFNKLLTWKKKASNADLEKVQASWDLSEKSWSHYSGYQLSGKIGMQTPASSS